jgi:omega-3 fatty acid desaturase (delta-15 desaturase)
MDPNGGKYQKLARPTQEPPSLDTIRAAIPQSLFLRNTSYSIFFFVKDIVILTFLYSTMLYFETFFNKYFFLYPVWWFIIGTYFWALFVVGMGFILVARFTLITERFIVFTS